MNKNSPGSYKETVITFKTNSKTKGKLRSLKLSVYKYTKLRIQT